MRDIQPGDELTHSYVDCALPTNQRRNKLQNVYKFNCTCALCLPKLYISNSDNCDVSCCEKFKESAKQLINNPLELQKVIIEWVKNSKDEFIVDGLNDMITETIATEVFSVFYMMMYDIYVDIYCVVGMKWVVGM